MAVDAVAPSRRNRLHAARAWVGRHPHAVPIAAIIATVLVANVLYLSGAFQQSPIDWLSQILTGGRSGVTSGQNTIDPAAGLVNQALGHLAAEDLIHGHIPWWNPFEGVGMPLLGEIQGAALFPLTVLYLFANGQLYLHLILEAASGIGAYLLVSRFLTHRWVASLCGMVFAINGTFTLLGHSPANTVPFLPLMLLGVERARDAALERRVFGWGCLGLGFGLSVLGGFPESTYWDLLLVIAWSLVRLFQSRRGSWIVLLRKLVAGAISGAMISAPLIVAGQAMIKAADQSQYAASDAFGLADPHSYPTSIFPWLYGPIGGFSGYEHMGMTIFPGNVVSVSNIATTWDDIGGYVGISLVVLAIAGLFGKRHRWLRALLAFWIFVMIGRGSGFYPVIHVLAWIPGSFANFYRFSPPVWELCTIILAGFGLDDVASGLVSKRRMGLVAIGSLVVFGVAFLEAWQVVSRVHGAPDYSTWVIGSVGGAAAVLVLVVLGASFLRGTALALVVGTLVLGESIGLFIVPQLSSLRATTLDTPLVSFMQTHLGTNRFFTFGPLEANYGAYYDLESIDTFDNPIPITWSKFISTKLDPEITPFAFTGESFWQAPNSPSPEQEMLDHLSAYEQVGVKYVLAATTVSFPSSAHLTKVYSDPWTTVYQMPTTTPLFHVVAGSCVLQYGNIEAVTATCSKPSRVVRSELDLPGITATRNGATLQISPSGSLFESVNLPRGVSTVTFGYVPKHGTLAFLALVVALLWLVAMTSWAWVRKRSKRRAAVS